MKDQRYTLAFAGLLLASGPCPGGTTNNVSPPEITVPVCVSPPRIDGEVNDECWKTAAAIDAFRVVADGTVARQHKAWVTRDNEWLYVAFDVAQSTLERDPARCFAHDDLVQREDNVQVSFDPGTDGELYYQFLLNKANTRADFRMTKAKGRERENWNIPWRSATREQDKGWQAEIALPFALIATHGDLKNARLNLIIDTFLLQRDRQMARMGVKRVEMSWAPLAEQFDEPARFGRILGIEADTLRAPFLPFVTAARITGYTMAEGRYSYGVEADVQGLSGVAGNIRLAVDDRPEAGSAGGGEQEVEIKGNSSVSVRVAVPVQSLSRRSATLSLRNAATGETLQKMLLADTSALDLFSAFLDRDYYTGEDAAVAVCRIGLPANVLTNMALAARDADGRRLAEDRALRSTTRFRIPLAGLAVGEHVLAVDLVDPRGGTASSQNLRLLKKTPKPGLEVKVDRENRVLLRDGRPFFPYGVLMSGVSPSQDAAFAEVADIGFNTVVQWFNSRWYAPDGDAGDDSRRYLDAAAKHGLQAILFPDECNSRPLPLRDPQNLLGPGELDSLNKALRDSGGMTHMKGLVLTHPALTRLPRAARSTFFTQHYENNLPRLIKSVEGGKDHPGLVGYYLFDEPIIVEFEQYIAGRMWYRKMRETDGYHPAFVLYSSEIPAGAEATDWCDCLGTDPYWVPATAGRGVRGTVNFVPKIVATTRRRADEMREVTFTVPMLERWSATRKRPILPEEQRCQTYLALIHGSRGIFYFCYPFIAKASCTVMRGLAAEMKTLGPICVTPDVPQKVAYEPGVLDPEKDVFTDVQVCLRRAPAGGSVLLAANTAWYPVETTFALPTLVKRGTVKRLFARDTCRVKDGAFTDLIEPMGTRAYLLPGAPAGDAPVPVSVKMAPRKDQARREEIKPDVVPGRKNLVPNPSFEESTLPGWPDFFLYTGMPLTGEERVGGSAAAWGVVADAPFHGTNCLKTVLRKGLRGRRVTYREFNIVSETEAEHVLSVYLRANRDGVKVLLDFRTPTARKEKSVTVTREWKRYDVACTVPARNSSESYFFVWVGENDAEAADDTVVWMDAMQIERGSSPTVFEP